MTHDPHTHTHIHTYTPYTYIYAHTHTDFLANGPEMYKLFELVLLVACYFSAMWLLRKLERQMSYALRRVLSMVVSGSSLGCVVYLFCNHLDYVRYTAALYYVTSALVFVSLLAGSQHSLVFYKFHDYVVGNFIFFLLGVMSLCQVGYLQVSVGSYIFV